jgi:hypothetical protein
VKIKRRTRIIIGLGISLVSAVVLALIVDWSEFARALGRVNYWYLIPAVACIVGSYLCRAFQWRYILGRVRRLPVGSLFRLVMIGFFANVVLPARLGELARAYLLARKHKLSQGTALASIIVERLIDGAILFLLLAGLTILIPTKLAGLTAGITTGFVVYIGVVGFFVLFYFNRDAAVGIIKFTVGRFSKRGVVKTINFIDKFIHGFSCFRSPADLAKAFLYSAGVWFLIAASFYFINLGFKLTTPLPKYAPFLLLAIENVAVAIPSSPGYIGTMEWGLIAGLKIIRPAISRHEALSYAVVVHVVQLLPSVILGLYYLWTEHLTIADLTRAEEFAPER